MDNKTWVREIRTHLKARDIYCLLNVGPDCLGRILTPAAEILLEAAD